VPAQREADYQTVVKAAEGFEGNFVMRPSSEAEVRRTLAAMVSRGATVDDIQKYYYRLSGSKYASIVSSGMVAHARTPFEHAVCRTLYASDLWYTMRTESGTPPDVLMEMEEALEEARGEGIHTNVAYTAYLVHTLGANVYAGEEHDFDKSWALYLQYEELLANKSFVRNGYFQSLAAEITRGKVPHKISDETLRDMRERVEALAVDPKTDEVGRSHCSNLLKALEKREQGGATRTIN